MGHRFRTSLVCVAAAASSALGAPPATAPNAEFASAIRPIFEHRCVPCHACYDSPCQLNLQSYEGLDRGGNQVPVYHPSRIEAMAPTRMFQDAQSTSDWKSRFGFFPVVSRDKGNPLGASLLWRMVEHRRTSPGGTHFDVDAALDCPRTTQELEQVMVQRPELGMPFGFPPLNEAETGALSQWIRAGSPGPASAPGLIDAHRIAIAKWEAFFNASDAKTRIAARYLFEHLFLAHLNFEGTPARWFRLVRSRTAAPAAVDEIATVRPYDDPGTPRFYYRFRPVDEAIVLKTHVPYALSDAKLARFRQLFLDSDWGKASTAFPSYAREVAANPFVAFAAIPARSRYQYLLDDARYHVQTFIHGPVCKGQVALNVIDEHFLILFLSPDADPAVRDAGYLRGVARNLAVPAEGGNGPEAIYARFKLDELAYLRAQGKQVAGARGRQLADIWNGDGHNPNAVLTVYRHFDSAFVLRGALGGIPKTAWVMDYPIFERIYYDLVAGFDVFGNVTHQLSTRRYMNLLRIESENQFLRFLPVAARKPLRDSWYRGAGVAELVDIVDPFYGGPEPGIHFTDRSHAKEELLTQLFTHALPPAVVGPREPIQWKDVLPAGDASRARFELALRDVTAVAGRFVRVFPDTALLRVRSSGGASAADDWVYTVIRNRAHTNIDFMFLEDQHLVPDEDTLHVVRGIAVSRPNLFLEVAEKDVASFVGEWKALAAGSDAWAKFVSRWAVRRSDARFWRSSDFFDDWGRAADPTGAGILDLSRYAND